MPVRRAVLALAGAVLALSPALALGGIPVAIYPLRVPGLSAAQRADLYGMLEAGLASASRRGILSPRAPLVLPETCGNAPAPACLAEAAKGGLILAGRGELRSGVVLVNAALWDSSGTRTRQVRFIVDLVIQNLRPFRDSLLELEMEIGPDGHVVRDDRAPPVAQGGSAQKAPALAAAPPPAAVTAAPQKTAAAARLAEPARAPRGPPLWRRTAGPWLTGVGAALLAGGATVAVLNRDLANDLDARYANHQLSAADRSSYDRVRTYNLLSTSLFAAGGVAIATGTWIWISAPAAPGAPAAVGAGGRF